MPSKSKIRHRLERSRCASGRSQRFEPHGNTPKPRENVAVDCGWGRLLFGQTFDDLQRLTDCLREERPGKRDIALYLDEPHVILSLAPQELFLDPSHTFRLWLERYQPGRRPVGFSVRLLNRREDAAAIHDLYLRRHMVPPEPEFVWGQRASRVLTYLVAEDKTDGRILGAVTGVDHKEAFNDPQNGCSLWALAVDPEAQYPGIGEALLRQLIEYFQARGRSFLDLSVMHDNRQAIGLYRKLGFERVQVFALKRKNPYNEPLFIGAAPEEQLNPYARIIIDEARRRGIGVEVLDPEAAYFALTFGGRSVVCRESLSELTSAVAMSRCDDKVVTHRVLAEVGLRVPAQTQVDSEQQATAFLERYGALVVKPARGEQGEGISVDIRRADDLHRALERARRVSERVLLEEYVAGDDLRIIVIDFQVVAAAIRRPPVIVGSGKHSVAQLIEKLSRRRGAATGGESRIPMDGETERCVSEAGYEMHSILPEGTKLRVRKTANLHTGGTLHDVTAALHPELKRAAETAARALDIPVTGLDFIVPAADQPEYVIIEANERPGLANHEPQPTAERFIDLLFPQTAAREA
jgi:GNAT-family acetyltransferase (TIGR03103 family)